ncbi:DNA-binding protein [Streptomyces sp. PU-14G]|uniref:DNA-binding protein n=1 Tax=Streptomyces sp. PU-14G TaxID=2800808 RepID=UPI0034DE2950
MTGHERRRTLTFPEVFDLPLSVDLRTAARAFGVCTATAYKLIRCERFPCPVLRVGRQYRIPTAHMLSALGIEEHRVFADDVAEGAEHVEERPASLPATEDLS